MIRKTDLDKLTDDHLVAQFLQIGLDQYEALLKYNIRKHNTLYDAMVDVKNELKRRQGDQRRALLPLLEHPNVHVKMKAASALLAIYPELAKRALASVRDSRILPQAADASMMLDALDNGSFVAN